MQMRAVSYDNLAVFKYYICLLYTLNDDDDNFLCYNYVHVRKYLYKKLALI